MRDEVVADGEILDVFRDADEPILTTAEIAGHLDIEERGLRTRLNKLTEEGLIRKKAAGSGVVWWHPESARTKF